MISNMQANHQTINISRSRVLFPDTKHPVVTRTALKRKTHFKVTNSLSNKSSSNGSAMLQQRPPSSGEEAVNMIDQMAELGLGTETMNDHDHDVGVDSDDDVVSGKVMDEYLVREYGWKVRRMVEDQSEMREVARIQAEAFHNPVLLFDDFFFQFFQAEVLSGLLYRLRNSPPDRYACLVAERATKDDASTRSSQAQEDELRQLVGVVDVTVLRDNDVLQHLLGAQEYLYVSGIAVLDNFRRQKVATVLLKACEVTSVLWGYEYMVLRAYEDDWGARALYTNAGYRLVSTDPPWVTLIGRKRRILMIKRIG